MDTNNLIRNPLASAFQSFLTGLSIKPTWAAWFLGLWIKSQIIPSSYLRLAQPWGPLTWITLALPDPVPARSLLGTEDSPAAAWGEG